MHSLYSILLKVNSSDNSTIRNKFNIICIFDLSLSLVLHLSVSFDCVFHNFLLVISYTYFIWYHANNLFCINIISKHIIIIFTL